ncbi:hypothetical protein ACLOJK_023400 [Asimina triloba]
MTDRRLREEETLEMTENIVHDYQEWHNTNPAAGTTDDDDDLIKVVITFREILYAFIYPILKLTKVDALHYLQSELYY